MKQEILPGVFIHALGYNGSTPGPTIIVNPGDYVNIRVINHLNEPTSVHWHGLNIPNNKDGVPQIEATPYIAPGSYIDYHFRITNPPGTHMYHTPCGYLSALAGAFIIENPIEYPSLVQKDYFFMLQEFALKGLDKGEVKPGIYEVNPKTDQFNFCKYSVNPH